MGNILDANRKIFRDNVADLEWIKKEIYRILIEITSKEISLKDVAYKIPNVAGIERRIKDEDSFIGKISRAGKSYKNPFTDITDIIGFRVITFYETDIKLVEEIVRSCPYFHIDKANSQDTKERLKPNEFGYKSVHLVFALTDLFWIEKADCKDVSFVRELRMEIQIRTILQHAWANLDHRLTYKSEDEPPEELRRKIAILSAILENADDYSVRLQRLRQDIQTEYGEKILRGGYLEEIKVDAESVNKYIEISPEVEKWLIRSREIGWIEWPPISIDKNDDSLNHTYGENYEKNERERREKIRSKQQLSALYSVIKYAQINRLIDLDKELTENFVEIELYLIELNQMLKINGEHLYASSYDIIRAIILKTRHDYFVPQDLIELGYSESLRKIFEKVCKIRKRNHKN